MMIDVDMFPNLLRIGVYFGAMKQYAEQLTVPIPKQASPARVYIQHILTWIHAQIPNIASEK